jgi:hypothetical protein
MADSVDYHFLVVPAVLAETRLQHSPLNMAVSVHYPY